MNYLIKKSYRIPFRIHFKIISKEKNLVSKVVMIKMFNGSKYHDILKCFYKRND
jgi:hypothetical protein